MIKFAEAIQRITAEARVPLSSEKVKLDQAIGRVAASDLLSRETVPPFDNSSMDGFAVRSEWTRGASPQTPLRFRVLGSVVAGDVPPASSGSRGSEARPGVWEIMTGAPFPVGFDASIRVEDVRVLRDASGLPLEIEISAEAALEQYRRKAGEDFSIGTQVLRRGEILQPEHLLALSSLGVQEVEVLRRPRIAVLSTGRELAEPGTRLEAGQIHNSTAHFLNAAIERLGATPMLYGIAPDEPEIFTQILERILSDQPDLIITTGAVSMGKHDFIEPTLQKMGAQVRFHKVAIRPGKPVLFCKLPNGPILFGLPGNPVSTVVGLRFFIEPYLRALQGRPLEKPLRARLSHTVGKPEGLRCFFKAQLSWGQSLPSVRVLPGQMSFLVRPLLEANGWAVLEEEGDEVSEGTEVDFFPPYSLAYDWTDKSPSRPLPPEAGCCT